MNLNNGTYEIRNLGLASLDQSHGVELEKKGSRHVACCPFYFERTGSFLEALERFGIKRTNKPYAQTEIKKFKENKIKNFLIKEFQTWEARTRRYNRC
jgi:hypothetical protein